MVVVHITCPKCHLTQFAGFTSIKSIERQKLRQQLATMLEKAKTPATRLRLKNKLKKLERDDRLSELGL